MDPSIAAPAADTTGPIDAVDPATIPEIDHYELDGVPLYHIPMAGATILTLAFGTGRADEPVIRGGMTHLAEHLILTAINDVFDHANGTTEPFRVTFVTRGSPREVSKFLRDVCASIDRPRLGRAHQEAKVLRTEAAGRSGMHLSLRLLWLRTGYQGIGTLGLPEFFLDAVSEDVLRAWIAEHFVAGNAAIWIAGELPDDLEVSLPPGPRPASRAFYQIDGLETPTALLDDAPGVGASFYVRRDVPTAAGFRALARILTQRLRVDRGLGYEIGTEYQPVNRDAALVSTWATCLPEATRDVQQVLLECIDDVAARGPSPDDVSRDYRAFVRDMADPRAIPGRLDKHVRDVLLGEDSAPTPVAQMVDEQWRLEPESIAASFKAARDSMLLILPQGWVDPQRPFRRYPGPPTASVGADRVFDFVSKDKGRFRRKSTALRLSVGRHGVAVDATNGERVMAVPWSHCVGIIRERGIRSILGRDGTVLQVFESEWREGGTAVRLVDQRGPSNLVVRLD